MNSSTSAALAAHAITIICYKTGIIIILLLKDKNTSYESANKSDLFKDSHLLVYIANHEVYHRETTDGFQEVIIGTAREHKEVEKSSACSLCLWSIANPLMYIFA